MRSLASRVATCLAGAAVLAIAGCGSGGDGAKATGDGSTASINGPTNAASSDGKSEKPSRDPLHPVVQFDTSLGKFSVELDADKAGLTVNNFLELVEKKFYDQTIIHQVAKGDIVLGGGFTADMKEKPAGNVPVRNEADKALKNVRGTIAKARGPSEIDSASPEFFFNLADNPRLDFQGRTPEKYGYCAFGRVISGMEVLDQIGEVAVEDGPDFPMKPVKTVLINSVKRIR